MRVFKRTLVLLLYIVGMLLIAVPFFIVAIVAIITYPIIVIFSDILVALGIKKR